MSEVDPAGDLEEGEVGREIYGGTDAGPDEYLATIRINKSGAFDDVNHVIGNPTRSGEKKEPTVCTGVLIAPNVGITAGHCLSLLVEQPEVTIGPLKTTTEADAEFVRIRTKGNPEGLPDGLRTTLTSTWIEVASYKDQKRNTTNYDVPDIALFQIEELPDDLRNTLQRANIADGSAMEDRGYARIVGYGLTETGALGAKKFADVEVVAPKCEGDVPARGLPSSQVYGCLAGREIVAGSVREVAPSCSIESEIRNCVKKYTDAGLADRLQEKCTREAIEQKWGGKMQAGCADTCVGDSGGPIFVATSGNRKKPQEHVAAMDSGNYALAGITSRAVDTEYVSAHQIPNSEYVCGNGGIYTRLSGDTLLWVKKQIACWDEGGYLEFSEDASMPTSDRFQCKHS